ncbi:uncharacterized protein LOC117646123 isoform X5 [Thrips palmi]|uniref:Uncharacterized protein LOC117646123 isoform X5 n=1 Tax=Thrips palmi TaxID=161013 RepID=A0A6P8YZR9_THRPL|nr:uncharacterized protein LOC117646123 isoform X5 [Thrips palmi]
MTLLSSGTQIKVRIHSGCRIILQLGRNRQSGKLPFLCALRPQPTTAQQGCATLVLLLPPKSTCIRSVPRGDSFPTDAAPRVPVWRKMECQICLENFNVADHRPKTLPCGHSFCLQCLKRLPTKTCPNDSLPFFGSADALADNFTVIKLCSQRPMQMHCKKCNRVATTTCEDEQHEVLSLRRARAQDAGPVLAALRRAEERLDKLGKALVECLDEERAGLAAARARLQEAMGASPDAWEQAKQAALSRSSVELADPAQARLVLSRLPSGGALQVPEERHGAKRRHSMIEGLGQRAPAPCSQERSSGAARSLPVGTRVVRGPHWGKTWTYDGTPPRPGTVRVWYEENLRAEVKWDSGVTQWVSYGQNYKYHVVPLTDLGSAPQQ